MIDIPTDHGGAACSDLPDHSTIIACSGRHCCQSSITRIVYTRVRIVVVCKPRIQFFASGCLANQHMTPLPASITQAITGWGNHPVQSCRLYRPETRHDAAALLGAGGSGTYIGRGLGRSYGDAALNDDQNVVLMTRLDRMIDFDAETGVLTCEAGVSLQKIIELFLPRGFCPLVVPGTQFVTVGGAIAADVHGKNHHQDGSFGTSLIAFELLSPTGQILHCNRETNSDVFCATLGGMGMTGLVLTAQFRLHRVESAYLAIDQVKATDIEEILDIFEREDQRYRYSVAWIDCLARKTSLGRGVLIRGDHALAADLPRDLRDRPLSIPTRRSISVPFQTPAWLLNRQIVRSFNAAYYRLCSEGRRLVDFHSFFFPLDRVRHWNWLYGCRGFMQYQCVLSEASGRAGLLCILNHLGRSIPGSYLAVLKRLGPKGEGLLSFPMSGPTLCLDFPNLGQRLINLVRELDAIVLEHGGRVYLAKDACLQAKMLAPMYPRLEEFQRIQGHLDPEQQFSSSLARRIGLLEYR